MMTRMDFRRAVGVSRDTFGWWITLLSGAAIALPVAGIETAIWRAGTLTTFVAVAATILIALFAAIAFGRVELPARAILYRLVYPIRLAPWKVRELLSGGRPGNGKGNPRWVSEDAYYAAMPLGTGSERSPEHDFGLNWRRGRTMTFRIRWIEKTGELIALSNVDPYPVEVIAKITDETEVYRRLDNWAYALGDLRWARRRAHGWAMPLPPRGRQWRREDSMPGRPWPPPPLPSLCQRNGIYVGTKRDRVNSVEIITPDHTHARTLYHYVQHSPAGFAWGYTGDGPHDLARSLLADRLGYVPNIGIYSTFCADVIAEQPEFFVLTFEQVDSWIDDNRKLWLQQPRAEPFDPYARGGQP
jgi:Family of unknown function (DUF6166)